MSLSKFEALQLDEAVHRMVEAAGDRLISVVLYGAAARQDHHDGSELHLLVVLRDLELSTLAAVRPALLWWVSRRHPLPRLFSPELLAKSADVFPMELADLSAYHIVLWGQDPIGEQEVAAELLRLQCERELREKMMRLREGFIEADGKRKALVRLMTESYSTFVLIFRAVLRLRGGTSVPQHDDDVVNAFVGWARLDGLPFQRIAEIKKGHSSGDEALFHSYYQQLRRAVMFTDRFVHDSKEAQ